ncbi:MAG: ABC transporter permease [Proteobacteria bacterium TMED51]|jgi:spermidine/putrescine transport system permease protein|nr:MAG: ABC transporter permease [Proteobacteria bacterium TMED51]|tara:strand:+ start:149 stop:1051 length:903 start_codon:yes stop_codon:yes gene_type:complete
MNYLQREQNKQRWFLLSPAFLFLIIGASGPLLIVIAYSFLKPGDYGGVIWEFSLNAWIEVILQEDIFDETLGWADAHLVIFWRSIKLSVITTILTLIMGVPLGYFIATRPGIWKEVSLFLITLPFWTNLLVRTFAVQELIRNQGVINSFLKWTGLIENHIQMMFTDFAIAFGMTYVYLPLMVLPVYASVARLDFRLIEAGYDLYANRAKLFYKIILPLIKPGIIAGSILVFIPSLGAYVTPRVLGGGTNLMIGNLISLQYGQGRNWPLGAALSLTLLIAVVIALIYYVRVVGEGESKKNA